MRPLFVYDGECSFCRFWLAHWQRRTRGKVRYEPYQKAAAKFPGIPREEFARAAMFIESDRKVYSGAAAVFRLWTYRSGLGKIWWWAYRLIPPWARASEFVYGFVARHRPFFWMLTRIISSFSRPQATVFRKRSTARENIPRPRTSSGIN